MINIRKVDETLSIKMDELQNPKLKKGQKSKISGQINFLRMVIAYLETGPTDEFLLTEIKKLQKREQLIMDGFKDWIPNKYFEKESQKLKEYQKETGIPKIKNQIKALKYIANA